MRVNKAINWLYTSAVNNPLDESREQQQVFASCFKWNEKCIHLWKSFQYMLYCRRSILRTSAVLLLSSSSRHYEVISDPAPPKVDARIEECSACRGAVPSVQELSIKSQVTWTVCAHLPFSCNQLVPMRHVHDSQHALIDVRQRWGRGVGQKLKLLHESNQEQKQLVSC